MLISTVFEGFSVSRNNNNNNVLQIFIKTSVIRADMEGGIHHVKKYCYPERNSLKKVIALIDNRNTSSNT